MWGKVGRGSSTSLFPSCGVQADTAATPDLAVISLERSTLALRGLFRVHHGLGVGVPVSCLNLVLTVLPLLPNIQPFPPVCVLEPHPYDLPLPNGFRWSLANGSDRLTVVAEVPSSTSGLKEQPFPRSGHHPSLRLQPCEGLKPPSCCWPKCAFPSHASSLRLCKQSLYQTPLMTPTHPQPVFLSLLELRAIPQEEQTIRTPPRGSVTKEKASSLQHGRGSGEGRDGRAPEPRAPGHSSAGVRTQVTDERRGDSFSWGCSGSWSCHGSSRKRATKELAWESIPKAHRESEREGPQGGRGGGAGNGRSGANVTLRLE